jgi:hypothetical protein
MRNSLSLRYHLSLFNESQPRRISQHDYHARGFDFELEVTANVANLRCAASEVQDYRLRNIQTETPSKGTGRDLDFAPWDITGR